MPSFCHSIKAEYEALKKLNAEFVSACEKAGDPRALSAEQLCTLQIQKQKLEKARDELRDKIENEETRTLKRLWNEVMETVIDSEHSPQRTIEEMLQNNTFRTTVTKGIQKMSTGGLKYTAYARGAVVLFASACDLGLLSDEQKGLLERVIVGVKDMASAQVQGEVSSGDSDGASAYNGIVGYAALHRVGGIDSDEWLGLTADMRSLRFRKHLTDELLDVAGWGVTGGGRESEQTMIGFSIATELGLINDRTRNILYDKIGTKEFQKTFIAEIAETMHRGFVSPIEIHPIQALNALKKLIRYSLRQKVALVP